MARTRSIGWRFRNVTLRTKLMTSFLSLAVLAGLTGLAGWYFIGRIDRTLAEFVQKAAPTVKAADDLAVNLARSDALAKRILAERRSSVLDVRAKEFDRLDRLFTATFQKLQSLVAGPALRANLQAALAARQHFTANTRELIQVRRVELAKGEEVAKALKEFHLTGSRITDMLSGIAAGYRQGMTEAEASGNKVIKVLDEYVKETQNQRVEVDVITTLEAFIDKSRDEVVVTDVLDRLSQVASDISVQLLTARTQDRKLKRAELMTATEVNRLLSDLFQEKLPPVEASLKLQCLAAEVLGASNRYMNETDPDTLAGMEKAFGELLEQSRGYIRVLIGKAGTLETKMAAGNMDMAFVAWGDEALGEGKLFSTYRDQLKARTTAVELADRVEEEGLESTRALEEIATAVRRISLQAQEEASRTVSLAVTLLSVVILAGFVLSLTAGIIITRSITRPMSRAVDLAETMAAGDFSRRLEFDRSDEVGLLTGSLDRMSDSLAGMFREIANGVGTLSASSDQLSELSRQMSAGANQTLKKADAASGAAESMSANMEAVAAAMEEATTGMDSVVASAEEMTATVNEIAGNTEKAASITASAVDEALGASEQMGELDQAAREVDMVTQTITDISEQTKLLSLNATIEAARAGEAGKGFAVVAGEIKELARGTAEATEEVQRKIDGIQKSARGALERIDRITGIINEVNEIVSVIAAAIEQQSASTNEVAINMAQTSAGIKEVARNVSDSTRAAVGISREMGDVNRAANEISQSSTHVNQRAEELSGLADQLKNLVDRFNV